MDTAADPALLFVDCWPLRLQPSANISKHTEQNKRIRLISKEPAGQRELNDPRVQQFIREQLRDSREQLLKAAYYDMVHNEAKIEDYYADDLLKSVK